jgi:hypothetical protein
MTNRKPEIAPAEYYHFIIDLLSCNDGVLPMTKVFDAIESFYGRHFSAADKRLMKLRRGSRRPKWKNNVDWAKAIGAKQGVLATVTHQKQKWLVLLEEADDFWVKKAQKKKKKRSFKKKCPKCNVWCRLGDEVCETCDHEFPPTPEKRRID